MIRTIKALFSIGIFLFISALLIFHPSQATARLTPINHRVVDAEYSKSLDRIITVSATPNNQLHVYDPETGEDAAVDLPKAPTCVSVSPDGTHAAVGHDGLVSFVDLKAPTLVQTYPASADVFDVVLAGNGYAYAFPRTDQWEHIRCINLQTGQETLSTGNSIFAESKAQLHPDGNSIYVVENKPYPYHTEKYSITAGTASFLYYSYSIDGFSLRGDHWISEDGLRIFTKGGKILTSSADEKRDIQYMGSIYGISNIVHLAHHTQAEKVVAIPSGSHKDEEVWILEDDFLQPNARVKLPRFPSSGPFAHGQYVFFNSAGSKYYVIVQAATGAGLSLDFGVADYQLTRSIIRYSIQTSTGGGGAISPAGDISVNKYGSQVFAILPNRGYEVADVQVDGISVGKKSSYSFDSVRQNHTISASFVPSTTGENPLQMLSHQVIDAEYSRHLNRIVSVSSIPLKQLHIFNPVSGDQLTVDLPLDPHSVSIAPDGKHAAVGHDGWISYIDLIIPELVKTYPVSTYPADIVLAGNGYVYAFPGGYRKISCINLETGEEILSGVLYGGRNAKLHPGGKSIYSSQGLSPSDVLKYGITKGTADFLYDSPYHGDYPVGDDLWISEDGSHIFTQGGTILRSSEAKSEDMTFNGAFSGVTSIEGVDHSLKAGRIVAIPRTPNAEDGQVRLWDDQIISPVGKFMTPRFSINGNSVASKGRFVFFNRAGDSYFVLVQAALNSGLPIDWAVVRYPTDASLHPHTISAAAGPGGSISPAGKVSVPYAADQEFVFTPDPGFRITGVTVDGVSIGKQPSYTFELVLKSHRISVAFAPIPIDFFGMQVGNTFETTVKSDGSTGQITSTVTQKDTTTFSQPTFVVEKTSGNASQKEWYQVTSTQVGIRGVQSSEGTITYSKPLILARSKLVEGDRWVSEANASAGGGKGAVKLEVSVGKNAVTRTPAGFFSYWPLTYKYTVSGPGGTVVQEWVEWFSPYIGAVKSRDSKGAVAQLGSFRVAGGEVKTPPLIITGITPASGTPGSLITIDGYNFGAFANRKSVSIGGKKVTGISSWENRRIICTVPPDATSGPVKVSAGFWAKSAKFNID